MTSSWHRSGQHVVKITDEQAANPHHPRIALRQVLTIAAVHVTQGGPYAGYVGLCFREHEVMNWPGAIVPTPYFPATWFQPVRYAGRRTFLADAFLPTRRLAAQRERMAAKCP